MQVIQNSTAANFLEKNETILLKNESFYNLILGLCNRLKNGEVDTQEALYFTIQDGDQVVGQALRTNNDKSLLLGDLKPHAPELLANETKDLLLGLKGVVGPLDSAYAFAKAWGDRTEVSLHMGVYQLFKVDMPEVKNCTIRRASIADLDLVYKFSLGYIKDCFPKEDRSQEALETAKRNIENDWLYLLEDKGQIVSMAAYNRQTKNAGTIALVYTPPEFRRNGYASIITALLSQIILDSGKSFCNLFTDLANPTSNSIYQKIGYKYLGEIIELKFV